MSKWSAVAGLALLVVTSGVSLKSNTSGPMPPAPWALSNTSGPMPPAPWMLSNTSGPMPPAPWR
jgi:hypothetical protein